MPGRLGTFAANTLALLFGLTVAIAAGELLLRAFWPQRSAVTIGMFRTDSDAGFRLQESYRNEVRTPEFRTAVVTDAEGYRVAAGGATPDRSARRLLAIGDSFIFGVGVDAEDALPERLAERLGGGWWVRNGGVGGYGPLRSSRLLVRRQAAWEPEVVVHGFYLGNDLEDSNPATFLTRPVVRDGRMVSPGRPSLSKVRLFLRTRSHLYSFLRDRLYGLYRWTGLSQRGQYLEPVGLRDWPPVIERMGWPAGKDAIVAVRDWAREKDVRYLVVLIPAKYHVDDGAWREYCRAWGLPEASFDRDHARREVLAFLDEIEVAALDLTDPLREAAAGGARLYYPVDRHWT
ncbi:MAG: hypothetical protein ACRDGR_08055, partial [bacterium]